MIAASIQKIGTVAAYWDLFQEIKNREKLECLYALYHMQVKLHILKRAVFYILQLEKFLDIKHIILQHTGTI